MGGTFDPVHFGHLLIAEEAGHQFDLEKIIFIPAGIPPHKLKYNITSADCRYKMVELAIEGNEKFDLSPIEITRPGPSYTVDTISELKSLHADSDFYLITGADAIVEILSWNRVAELAGLCYFIAATRPGYNFERLDSEISSLPEFLNKKIFTVEIPGLAISSTEIRKRVARGLPIKYLLPEKVEKYIFQNSLYRVNV